MSSTHFSSLQPNFKDYPVYLAKFKQCLSKAMHFMKIHIVNAMQNLTSQLTKRVRWFGASSCFPWGSTLAAVGQLVLPVPLLVLCRLLHFFSQYKDLHIQITGNSKLSLVVSANDLFVNPVQ